MPRFNMVICMHCLAEGRPGLFVALIVEPLIYLLPSRVPHDPTALSLSKTAVPCKNCMPVCRGKVCGIGLLRMIMAQYPRACSTLLSGDTVLMAVGANALLKCFWLYFLLHLVLLTPISIGRHAGSKSWGSSVLFCPLAFCYRSHCLSHTCFS